MTDRIRKALGDLRARQNAGEHIQSKEHTDHWQFVDVYTEMLTPSLIQMHPTCTQFAP